jgi:YHS domain-containing protein
MLRIARTAAFVAVAALAAACGGPSEPPAPPPTPPADSEAGNGLTIVEDASEVCMVYNTYMGRMQVRVEVDGKSYWSCCPACTDRLTADPTARLAKDPVTGETVDKARAVIAKNARNAVLYFASAQNVRAYKGAM